MSINDLTMTIDGAAVPPPSPAPGAAAGSPSGRSGNPPDQPLTVVGPALSSRPA